MGEGWKKSKLNGLPKFKGDAGTSKETLRRGKWNSRNEAKLRKIGVLIICDIFGNWISFILSQYANHALIFDNFCESLIYKKEHNE